MVAGQNGRNGSTVINLATLDKEREKDGALILSQNMEELCVKGMQLRQCYAIHLLVQVTVLSISFCCFGFILVNNDPN